MAGQRNTATMIVMYLPEHSYKHVQHMASRRGTTTNMFNTWLAGGSQLQTYSIHGWPEGHSYKHLQYMADWRNTVPNIPHPVAISVPGLLTTAGKTVADGVKVHEQWLNGLLQYIWITVEWRGHLQTSPSWLDKLQTLVVPSW